MAAAISPADRILSLVIQSLHWIQKPRHLASPIEMSGATSGLNEIFVHGRSPLCEVGGGNDHKFRPGFVMGRCA
jgi:hypothetical protein